MARAIDKQTMLNLIIEAKRTDPETGSFAEWLAEYLAEHLPTLTPPNEPLSIEQLREMDGKPVFLVDRTWLNLSAWGIVSVFNEGDGEKAYVYIHRGQKGTVTYPDQECGNCWLAYRRPPEGEDAK